MDPKVLDDYLRDLFDAAGFTAASAQELITSAYEDLLGYSDANGMVNADVRIGYWLDRLADDLALADFVPTFLHQAQTDRGNHVPEEDFAGNQQAVTAARAQAESMVMERDGEVPEDSTEAGELIGTVRAEVTAVRGDRDPEPEPEPESAELSVASVELEPTTPEPGAAFSLGVVVAETAGVLTQNLVVTIAVADTDIEKMVAANGTLTELEGTEATVTLDDLVIAEAGSYDVEVTLVADNAEAVSGVSTLDVVAPDLVPAFFAVTGLSGAEVEADATAVVSATLENTGEVSGSQDVVLTISNDGGSQTLTEADVELDGGAQTGVEFTVDPAALGLEAGDYDLTVATDDDSASQTGGLVVAAESEPEPAFFAVTGLVGATVEQGDVATVTIAIENTGGEGDTKAVGLGVLDGMSLEASIVEEVTLAGGASTELELSVDTAGLDLAAATYDLVVTTPDDSLREDAALVVEAAEPDPEPAFFAVTGLSGAEVEADATAVVSATLENTGEVSGSQDVVLTISNDGGSQTLTEADVELDGGAQTGVEFTVDPAALGLEAGDYDLTVATDDNSASQTGGLTVTDPGPQAELAINWAETTPEKPIAEEDFTLDVGVGEAAGIEPENPRLRIDVEDMPVEHEFGLPTFSDGNFVLPDFAIDAITDPGEYTMALTLDADNAAVATFDHPLTVLDPDLPDLSIDAIDIPGSSTLQPGEDFRINVQVAENLGNVTTGLTVSLEIAGGDIDQTITVNGQLDELSGGTQTVTFDGLSLTAADFYSAQVTVDAENANAASAERDFTVTNLPHEDIAITDALELLWVEDTAPFPHAAVGHLQVGHEGSSTHSAGTGFMISPQHVMTNHHVLQGAHSLADIESVSFYHGLNGSVPEATGAGEFAQGETEVDDGIWSLEGDIFANDSATDDIAILRLDEAIDGVTDGHFDWFWNESGGARDLVGEDVSWIGYPLQDLEQDDPATENPDRYQWQAFGEIEAYEDGDGQLALSESLMGRSGGSGAPLFREIDGEFEFVGAYTGRIDNNGEQTPVAATLTPDVHDWALQIVQADGFLPDQEMAG